MINGPLGKMCALAHAKPKPQVWKCPLCPDGITNFRCELGEPLPRLEGKYIHTHCFYRLRSTKGVTPPGSHPTLPLIMSAESLPQVARSM